MSNKQAAICLARELKALDQIDHPNVIKLRDSFTTKSSYCMVMDYCNGGDLQSYIDGDDFFNNKKVGECTARYIVRQICQGMKGIFDKNYVHRDIKLPNILLHFKNSGKRTLREATVKIGDLGFARTLTPKQWANSRIGSAITMAPELILKGQKYNQQVDVWAIGVITFQLLVGFLPFMAESYDKFRDVVDAGDFSIPQQLHLSTHCLHFINKCLQHDPAKRMHFSELLDHSWLTLTDEEILKSVKELDHKTDESWLKLSRMDAPTHEEYKEKKQIVLNARDMKKMDKKYREELNRGIDLLGSIEEELDEEDQIPENQSMPVIYDSESDDEEDSQNFAPIQSTLSIARERGPY